MVGGWVIVASYGIAAVLCVVCARRAAARSVQRRVWFGIGALMCMLAVNKHFDLQTWFTQAARDISIAGNWYEDRSRVQVAFLALTSVFGMIGLTMLWRTLRRTEVGLRIAVLGLVITLAFALLRLASLHDIDELRHLQVSGLQLKWILEFGGAMNVVVGATIALGWKPGPQRAT